MPYNRISDCLFLSAKDGSNRQTKISRWLQEYRQQQTCTVPLVNVNFFPSPVFHSGAIGKSEKRHLLSCGRFLSLLEALRNTKIISLSKQNTSRATFPKCQLSGCPYLHSAYNLNDTVELLCEHTRLTVTFVGVVIFGKGEVQ